jgi:co-chaperonin GroES (HSP10)
MTSALRMLGSRVALRRPPPPDTEHGGVVYMPELFRDEPNTATVIAAGPLAGVEPGDGVVVARWAGEQLADATCDRIGEERGHVYVMRVDMDDDSKTIVMRNGQPMPQHLVLAMDPVVGKLEGTSLDIVLPGACQEMQTLGTVIAAGERCECAVGQRVVIGKANGVELDVATKAAIGQPAHVEVRVLREFRDHVITSGRGVRHAVIGDEVRAAVEGEAAE